jgi:hypothetical protein
MAQFRLPLSTEESLSQRSENVQTHTSYRCWPQPISSLVRFWERTCLQGRIFLCEIRSLRARMKALQGEMPCLEFGPMWQPIPNSHPKKCNRTLARIADTQALLSNRPWASLGDLEIFLAGWDMGERFCIGEARNAQPYNSQSDANTSFSVPSPEPQTQG